MHTHTHEHMQASFFLIVVQVSFLSFPPSLPTTPSLPTPLPCFHLSSYERRNTMWCELTTTWVKPITYGGFTVRANTLPTSHNCAASTVPLASRHPEGELSLRGLICPESLRASSGNTRSQPLVSPQTLCS